MSPILPPILPEEMKILFADTSFYVAIFNPQDALHAKAKAVAAAHQGGVITTEFVLIEVGNFFCRGKSRTVFLTRSKISARPSPGQKGRRTRERSRCFGSSAIPAKSYAMSGMFAIRRQ